MTHPRKKKPGLEAILCLAPWLGVHGSPASDLEPPPQRTQKVEEYEARAAFLLSLAKFTEWPAEAGAPGEPFLIGVLGDSPMGPALESIAPPTFQGRRLIIRRFRTLAEVQPCHILYFPSAEERHLPSLAPRLAKHGVLTVGETSFFLGFGGAIHLFNEEGRLRFVLNRTALDHAHVHLSAQVQRLAKSVLQLP